MSLCLPHARIVPPTRVSPPVSELLLGRPQPLFLGAAHLQAAPHFRVLQVQGSGLSTSDPFPSRYAHFASLAWAGGSSIPTRPTGSAGASPWKSKPLLHFTAKARHDPSQARPAPAPLPVGHTTQCHWLSGFLDAGLDQPLSLSAPLGSDISCFIRWGNQAATPGRPGNKCGAGPHWTSPSAAEGRPRAPGRSAGLRLQLMGAGLLQ
ncbi:hypothetical protein NDU88_006323 [Pleurodeles waltl]|uniref:Uncharacterized protein n=1 Tax=Pleurodeles waltl TaxID=8319 RepID=A0AAV7UNM7_PLEWA|nr:hypothetical protein NDU88_006323 [Pleurodeles waltl]